MTFSWAGHIYFPIVNKIAALLHQHFMDIEALIANTCQCLNIVSGAYLPPNIVYLVLDEERMNN